MGQIYEQASRVVVWLGEYPGAKRADIWQMREPHLVEINGDKRLTTQGRKLATALESTIRNSTPKWHERAWGVQEYALAKGCLVYFGTISIDFKVDLITDPDGNNPVRRYMDEEEDLATFYLHLMELVKLRKVVTTHQFHDSSKSMMSILPLTRSFSCSDGRDRVYSLLSLISTREALLIQPDYSQSVTMTYAKATFAAISAYQNFALLLQVHIDRISIEGIPTWALDFRSTSRVGEEDESLFLNYYQILSRRGPGDIRANADGRLLSIEGNSLDLIDEHERIGSEVVFQSEQSAAQAATPAALKKLGETLVHLLRVVAMKRDRKTRTSVTLQSFEQTLSQIMSQSQDFEYFSAQPYAKLIGKAFLAWNYASGMIFRPSGKNQTPFWEYEEPKEKGNLGRKGDGDFRLWIFLDYAIRVSQGAEMFVTNRGYLGIAPLSIDRRDEIVLTRTGDLPMILRPFEDRWIFRGFAWVHGIEDESLVHECWDAGWVAGKSDLPEKEYVIC